jgi:hypothetical protein
MATALLLAFAATTFGLLAIAALTFGHVRSHNAQIDVLRGV